MLREALWVVPRMEGKMRARKGERPKSLVLTILSTCALERGARGFRANCRIWEAGDLNWVSSHSAGCSTRCFGKGVDLTCALYWRGKPNYGFGVGAGAGAGAGTGAGAGAAAGRPRCSRAAEHRCTRRLRP